MFIANVNLCLSQVLLVLLAPGEAYIVDLRKKARIQRVELCEMQDDSDDESQMNRSRYVGPILFCNRKNIESGRFVSSSAMTVARFEPSGKHVFVGTSTGSVLVFNTRAKSASIVSFEWRPFTDLEASDGCQA